MTELLGITTTTTDVTIVSCKNKLYEATISLQKLHNEHAMYQEHHKKILDDMKTLAESYKQAAKPPCLLKKLIDSGNLTTEEQLVIERIKINDLQTQQFGNMDKTHNKNKNFKNVVSAPVGTGPLNKQCNL